jgi:import inner membrane translocase subunit TIM23
MSRSALRPFTALQQARTQVLASSSRALATATNPSTSSDTLTNKSTGPLPLTWPDYLRARRSRKLWSTLTSIPSTFAGLTLGGGYFASIEADPTQTIMGIEPM